MGLLICSYNKFLLRALFIAIISAGAAVMQVHAQYPITSISKKYFTEQETDSLYQSSAKKVFDKYHIPAGVFEDRYPGFKAFYYRSTNKNISNAFRIVELQAGNSIKAASGSNAFKKYKALYIKEFDDAVLSSFYANKELRGFMAFDKNDRITYYKSKVIIQKNGTLHVIEDISIYNGNGSYDGIGNSVTDGAPINDQIKRGIYRTFPTQYIGDDNYYHNTSFKLKEVSLDAQQVPYTIGSEANGKLLRIGDADNLLSYGAHTYHIVYETKNQLKFLDDMDELAWNVTGNGWDFSIDSSACTVVIPANEATIQNACYTGFQGSTAKDCSYTISSTGDSTVVVFKTTIPLNNWEGFSVGTGFKKGIVTPPSTLAIYWNLFVDNPLVFWFPLLALLLLAYNTLQWWRKGKDPKKGNIFPQFYPRKDMSPAAMGFVYDQKFSNKLIAATLVDLAVRNKMTIQVETERKIFKTTVYKIGRSNKTPIRVSYPDHENEAKSLIGTTISKSSYNSSLESFINKMQAYYKDRFVSRKKKPGLFSRNIRYITHGIILIILLSFVLFVMALISNALNNPWQLTYSLGGLVFCIAMQIFFYQIMPAYSEYGRQVQDEIEGFRMFLKAADEQRINAMNPPEKTLELYERYMPYAIALSCENEWGEQFKDVLNKAGTPVSNGSLYASSFYHDMGSDRSFASSFASGFSGSIASASTPPSSSSGGSSFSSGGGSSGGGGGGGGGGGW